MRGVLCRAALDAGDLPPPKMKESIDAIENEWDRLTRRYRDKREAMIGIMVGPNTPGINATSDLVVASKKFADSHGLVWNPHIAESSAINDRVRAMYGQDGVVEYLDSLNVLGPNLLAAHCVHLNAKEIKLFSASKSTVGTIQ